MEEITRSWNNLSLDEREGSRITLKNSLRSSEFIVAAKFLTRRAISMDAVAKTFSNYGVQLLVLRSGT